MAPGQWLLTFLGSAREVVSEEHATRVNAALDALDAIAAGRTDNLDEFFADLVERGPTLPERFRPDESS